MQNYRRKGPGHGEPAMFDPENKRGKLICYKRRESTRQEEVSKVQRFLAYKVDEANKLDEDRL